MLNLQFCIGLAWLNFLLTALRSLQRKIQIMFYQHSENSQGQTYRKIAQSQQTLSSNKLKDGTKQSKKARLLSS